MPFDYYEYRRDGEPVCDFCSRRPVTWGYPMGNFISLVMQQQQTNKTLVVEDCDGWAACDTCKALIAADEREKLIERSTECFLIDHPEFTTLRPQMTAATKHSHANFWAHKVGDGVPVSQMPRAERRAS